MSDEYAVSRAFGPSQRPFRYGDGVLWRPSWLRSLEPVQDGYSLLWVHLVAHVANTANESGFFDPGDLAWAVWSELGPEASRRTAETFEAAGGLERVDGRWYVSRWREEYRYRGVVEQLDAG